MDHLLSDQDLEKFENEIVDTFWLGFDHDDTREYPVVTVDRYLEQRGMSTQYLDALLEVQEPLSDLGVLVVLQGWLFFGTLESVFAQHFPSKLFLYPGTICPMMMTRPLRGLFNWEKFFPWEMEQSASERAHRLRTSLSFLHKRVSLLAARGCQAPIHAPTFHTVLRLLMVCGATLYHLRHFLSNDEFLSFPQFTFDSTEGHQSVLKDKMVKNGWCRSMWRYMMDDFSVCMAEYVSVINATDGVPLNHDQCSDDICVAKNADLDRYAARHTTLACGCLMLRASLESIKNAYQTQKIPLVHIDRLLDDTYSGDEVIYYVNKEETPYIAFSHVWSDGLCSDADSGLPRCQIERLEKLITSCQASEGSKTRLFYIDTLCIPRDEETRRQAINAMTSVYAKSSAVIVLDSTLGTIESASCSTAFLLVRVIVSPWIHRLWTLQEAMLAPRLYFSFQDKMIEAWDLLRRSRSEIWRRNRIGNQKRASSDEVYSPIEQECGGILSKILDLRASGSTNFTLVSHMLRHRTSSMRGDEFLGIASLIGIAIEPLTTREGLERTCEFWTQMHKVPANVIFQKQERVPIHGFSWAPTTMMTPRARPMLNTRNELATVTTHGLRGAYHLIAFDVSQDVKLEAKQKCFLLNLSKRELYGFVAHDSVNLTVYAGQRSVLAVDDLPPVRSNGGPRSYGGFSMIEAVLLSKLPSDSEVGLPQYKYVLQVAVNYGHEPWAQPVPWEEYENDPEYKDANNDMPVLRCHIIEQQELYIA